jgi:hypothetical protein
MLMHVIVYPPDNSPYRTDVIKSPNWSQIESAIRRLDKDEFPFIWIYRGDVAKEGNMPDLNIMGGTGDYYISAYFDGYWERCYFNEAQDEGDEVCVWESDQGFSTEPQRVCHDIEMILKTVRYFVDHLDFDPNFPWEKQTPKAR